MMDIPIASFSDPVLCGPLGLIVGVAIHLAVFKKGEWHVQSPQIAVVHVLVYSGLLLASVYVCKSSSYSKLVSAAALLSYGYLAGLFVSMLAYRTLFHPLTRAKFRGPFWARVSKLWHVWHVRDSRNHLFLDNLRKEYGDFVRTGPSEITVFHPDVFVATDGPRSDCIRSEWYDMMYPYPSLLTTRDKSVHATRKRTWNRGFSRKGEICLARVALPSNSHHESGQLNLIANTYHEAKTIKYIKELDRCIEKDIRAARPSEVHTLLSWFTYDSMGDLVFSTSFGMLRRQQWHPILGRLRNALSLFGPVTPVPWLLQLCIRLPLRIGPLKSWWDTVEFSEGTMRRRLDEAPRGETIPDLAHYLMEQDMLEPRKNVWEWVKADSGLAVVAASDTTAYTLISIICELAQHSEHAEAIYVELVESRVDVTDATALEHLPYLNTVITEALRLYPGFPTAGARKTTEKGAMIGGVFIPPHTTIIAPQYSIHRRDDCYDRPLEFVPERWGRHPEMVRNKAAFAPFGTGRHACPARLLAIHNISCTIAWLVQKYRFRLAPGETGLQVAESMRDHFVAHPGELRLIFELR